MAVNAERFSWTPTLQQQQESRLYRFLQRFSVDSVAAVNDIARSDPERFWAEVIDDIGIEWTTPPVRMLDTSQGIAWPRFWVDGHLNLVHNAVHRHAQRTPDKLALLWEGEDGTGRELTFAQLQAEVSRAAALLRQLDAGPGDCVGLYMPMIPECVALFLACSQVGAIAVPMFSGYGAEAIAGRLRDCEAKVLCIADGFRRRGQVVAAKPVADEAAAHTPSLRHVVVVPRLGDIEVSMQPNRDVWYPGPGSATSAEMHDTGADSPFMLIYTSGTTGRPKGTVHLQGGFPLKATQDMAHCFDVGSEDRLFWFTDIGWMMGPWAICGTLTLGATLCLYEGVPDYPAVDRLWEVVAKQKVSVLGVAPTVVRALMRHGDEPVRKHDLSSLRILGSSGEPWNEAPWLWFQDVVGQKRCPIINYSGGTEISGGILAGNLLTPSKPCAFAGPCPGMDADVVDAGGHSVRGQVGELVVRSPWPGMTAGFWRDPQRYLDTYWSRFDDVWLHGDWAEIDDDGLWYIRGRSDDTIKVAGKRLGPAEAESALVSHPAVAEAAAIGVPDELKGEALVVFVVLKSGYSATPELAGELTSHVGNAIGKALKPSRVEFARELPKTRNAKVLRRVIRAVYLGQDPGDLSAIESEASVAAIAELRHQR